MVFCTFIVKNGRSGVFFAAYRVRNVNKTSLYEVFSWDFLVFRVILSWWIAYKF